MKQSIIEAEPRSTGAMLLTSNILLRTAQKADSSASPLRRSSIIHDVLHTLGQPLDAETRTFMEPRFGHDFSGVRVHTDAKAAESARAVNALAYTLGGDVVFGAGQYTPGTEKGRRLLAHELTHVVQQKGSAAGNSMPQNVAAGQETALHEHEADRMAYYAALGDGYVDNDARGLVVQQFTGGVAMIFRQAVPELTASELSETLPEKERKKLIVITSAVSFDVDELFSTKIGKTTIPLPTGVTVRFASSVPAKLQHGLKNVAGMIVPKPLELNSTMTLALDLKPYGGGYSAYRFTYVEHKPRKSRSIQEVLIEGLGTIGVEGMTKSQETVAQKKFNAHGFKRGPGWSDSDFKSVLAAIEQIPDSVLSPVDGITFNRDRVDEKDPKTGGNYDPDTHTITILDRALQVSPTRFGTPGVGISTGTTRSIAHEIGHAIDLLPLRRAWGHLEQKQQALKIAFAQYENPPDSGQYSFPNTEQAKFNKLKAAITAAEKTLMVTRSESGERYVKGTGGIFEMVEGGAAAGSIEFRKAAKKDGGTRITVYSDKEWQEYYAESFSLYITDPGTLQRLRPNVYAFFSKKHPK